MMRIWPDWETETFWILHFPCSVARCNLLRPDQRISPILIGGKDDLIFALAPQLRSQDWIGGQSSRQIVLWIAQQSPSSSITGQFDQLPNSNVWDKESPSTFLAKSRNWQSVPLITLPTQCNEFSRQNLIIGPFDSEAPYKYCSKAVFALAQNSNKRNSWFTFFLARFPNPHYFQVSWRIWLTPTLTQLVIAHGNILSWSSGAWNP